MAYKTDYSGVTDQKSDFGCAICLTTSFVNGIPTGVKMRTCTGCYSPRQYCSKRCFEEDWKSRGHREECKLYAQPVSQDLSLETNRAIQLKRDADRLFLQKKLEEAILLYREAKILAVNIIQYIRDMKSKERKFRKHGGMVHELDAYLRGVDELHPRIFEELIISSRPDPMEIEMSMLAGNAANKMSFTHNKLKQFYEASVAAREALKLYPMFVDSALPQLLTALRGMGSSEALNEMEARYSGYKLLKDVQTMHVGLLGTKFISYKQYLKISNQDLYKVIDDEKKRPKEDKDFVLNTDFVSNSDSVWGAVRVFAVLIPLHWHHWICLGFLSNKELPERKVKKYMRLRLRPTDCKTEIDKNKFMVNVMLNDASHTAHIGTARALRAAHREIILFIHDVQQAGLVVRELQLATGLFNLFPPDKDPFKEDRLVLKNTEKYILDPGKFIPSYCRVVPAVDVDNEENIGD